MKTLKFDEFKKQQLEEMSDQEFKKCYSKFNRNYNKHYKKYVLDDFDNSTPKEILKQLDKMDKQLGLFHKIAKLKNITVISPNKDN